MSKAFALALGLSALGCAATPVTAPRSDATADFVVVGASIRTMDPSKPWAQALATRGDHIVAVGTESEMTPFVGPNTRTIRLPGKAIVPGLVDGHCHLYGLGVALESLDVREEKCRRHCAHGVGCGEAASGG